MSRARIERLRDKLLEAGRPSLLPPAPAASAITPREGERPETRALYARVAPLAEVMFLVMTSDDSIAAPERDTLRGMLRTLTDGALSSSAMEQMLSDFEAALAHEGVEQRLDTVAAQLYSEPDQRELALALAATAALADDRLRSSERSVLDGLAERLGVTPERVRALVTGDA